MGHSSKTISFKIAFLAVASFVPSFVTAGTDLGSSTNTNLGRYKIYSISKANILGESHTKNNAGVVVTSYTAVPQTQTLTGVVAEQPLKTSKQLKVASKVSKTEHFSEAPHKSSQDVYAQKSQKKPKISVSIFEVGMSSPESPPQEQILLPILPPSKAVYVPAADDVKQEIDAVEDINLPVNPAEFQISPYPIQYRIPTLPLVHAHQPLTLVETPATNPPIAAPHYNFAYQVHDSRNGNNHGHSEIRNGDSVHGQYSVLDPDGVLRVVSYTSDPVNGFKATVNRQLPSTSSIIAKRSSPLFERYSPRSYYYTRQYNHNQ